MLGGHPTLLICELIKEKNNLGWGTREGIYWCIYISSTLNILKFPILSFGEFLSFCRNIFLVVLDAIQLWSCCLRSTDLSRSPFTLSVSNNETSLSTIPTAIRLKSSVFLSFQVKPWISVQFNLVNLQVRSLEVTVQYFILSCHHQSSSFTSASYTEVLQVVAGKMWASKGVLMKMFCCIFITNLSFQKW